MDPLLCDRGCPEASGVLNSLILHSKHHYESYECEYYYYFYRQGRKQRHIERKYLDQVHMSCKGWSSGTTYVPGPEPVFYVILGWLSPSEYALELAFLFFS